MNGHLRIVRPGDRRLCYKCDSEATARCDYPACARECCAEHSRHGAGDLDYCMEHGAEPARSAPSAA